MIFVYNANGELLNKVPEKVYQGSNKANTVYFFAPFSSVSLVDLSFALPNGESRPKRLMTRVEDFTATELKIGTENLTCWAYDLNQAVTTYAGEVTLQFFVTNGGETVATNPAVFTVEKGVPPIEPDADIDTYENVISSVSALIGVMENNIADYIDESEERITEKTSGGYEFELSSDVLEVMPYGVAADLLKSDVSAEYGNIYAVRYENMKQQIDTRYQTASISIEGGVNI